MRLTVPLQACVMSAALAGCGGPMPPQGRTPYAPSAGMEAVLAEHQAMYAKPLADLSIDEARRVPTLADAAQATYNVRGLPAPVTEVGEVRDLTASGAEGALPARLYRPTPARDTPVIVYFPGGTWVTDTLYAADATARELAARTGWIVVAIGPRQAPEAPFPAAHDDAFAAYQWARSQMRGWGGDPTRVALAGEGVGANLALSTAMAARDRGVPVPDHLLLITPLVSSSTGGVSMSENARSRPLTRRTVRWQQGQYAEARAERRDPRLDLLARDDWAGLPAATVVLAEIDPLRAEGQAVADRLAAAGPLAPGQPGEGTARAVQTEARLFQGTAHGFFGLGQTVPEAAAAEDYAAMRLKAAFYRPALPALRQPVRARGRARQG
jgi:acetyl esterase/lipase